MKNAIWAGVTLTATAAIVACGGGGGSTSGESPSSEPTEIASSAQTAAHPMRRRPPIVDAKRRVTNEGEVWLQMTNGGNDASDPSSYYFAEFTHYPPSDGGTSDGCSWVPAGACYYFSGCSGPGGASGGSAEPEGAGTVTVSGGAPGSVAMTTNAKSEFEYVWDEFGKAFSSGDTLTVEASGGKFPAFGPFTVTAPGSAVITAPVAGKAGVYKIPTTKALSVTWTGGTADATLTLGANNTAGTAGFYCNFDGSSGAGTVPSVALAVMAGSTGIDLNYQQYSAIESEVGARRLYVLIATGGDATADFE